MIIDKRDGLHGGLALIRCFEEFMSLHGLEIHWNGSQGNLGPYCNTDRQAEKRGRRLA
jgi:hypothetical protein